jgi:hypothetical protein
MSTLWPHNPPVPTRRLRRGKGTAKLLMAQRWTMHWARELEAELHPAVVAEPPCSHVHCVWIKAEERYDCEVYA